MPVDDEAHPVTEQVRCDAERLVHDPRPQTLAAVEQPFAAAREHQQLVDAHPADPLRGLPTQAPSDDGERRAHRLQCDGEVAGGLAPTHHDRATAPVRFDSEVAG
ncbi:hypothetical protein GCM10025783_27910 [Amnibacterium soli]|uniref:Uncharacterized protein n=1 Tax=Amnibacterium soli TaxID=1282736 RepID=A0ABP8ZDH8_9MICO